MLARLARYGLRRGWRSTSRPWLMVGGAAWVVDRLWRAEEDVLYREQLDPGHTVTVSHLTEVARPTRRERRRSRGKR